MATMNAKRAGKCTDCGRRFDAGARIRWFPKIGSLCADKRECETFRDTPRESKRSMWAPEHAVEVATAARTLCGIDAGTTSHATPGFYARVECETCRTAAKALEDACAARLAAPRVRIAPVPESDFSAGLDAARMMLASVLS